MYLRSNDTVRKSRRWTAAACVVFAWPLLASGNAASDELLRHAEETRRVISWSVSEEELNRLMPEGWRSQREVNGPHDGANFFLVLAHRYIGQPAGGEADADDIQAAIWTGPAASDGEAGYMVLGGMITPRAAPGDYGVYMPATILVSRTTEQALTVEEWEIRGENGDDIRVRLAYDDEDPHQSYEETRTFSRLDPDIERFYEYDEDELILYSRAGGIEGVSELQVDASGGPLDQLLRGAQLTAVISMPHVSIEAYRPEGTDVPLMTEREQQLLVGNNDPS